MAQITFHDEACSTSGALPAVGTQAPAFTLVGKELADVSLADFAGKKVVLNIFPSIDTALDDAAAATGGSLRLTIATGTCTAAAAAAGTGGAGSFGCCVSCRDPAARRRRPGAATG